MPPDRGAHSRSHSESSRLQGLSDLWTFWGNLSPNARAFTQTSQFLIILKISYRADWTFTTLFQMFVPNLHPSTSSFQLSRSIHEPILLFLHYSNPVNSPSFSPLSFYSANPLLQKPTLVLRFFSWLITMSLWMWPPPAGPISSVYCAGVNFHFSLSIFREERDEVWFIQEIAPAATPDERFVWVWAGYHHLFSEWQWRKSKKKVLLTGRQWIHPNFFY